MSSSPSMAVTAGAAIKQIDGKAILGAVAGVLLAIIGAT